jgi:DNA-nicking Smr family endonuclease
MPVDDGDSQSDLPDDDAAAFAEAVRGARKLSGVRRVAASAVSAALSVQRLGVRKSKGGTPEAGSAAVPAVGISVQDTGEVWTARADGVDARLLRKLRAGERPIEARLDLHGLTRTRATVAINGFLAASRAAGQRCLLIIHGRGLHSGPNGPALREAVRASLTAGPQSGAVLVCCTAPPEKGGAGATLVFLRR